MHLLERAVGPRVGWLSLLGLVLVPLMVAGGFLWATWNSDTRLERVEAAIVNLDEPVTIDGQLVPLGRQLAGGLVNGEEDVDNFSWLLTDADDAEDGLRSGRYAAVVKIPESFSRQATSFSKSDAADIAPATLEVQTSQIRGIADTVVGETIAAAATSALNTQLTEQYLDNIYLGFNSTKKQFTTVADGAGKLADGAGDLSDGIGKTSEGADRLADGLEQLDDGTQQLATGAGQLSTGVTQFSTGLGKLADGTAALPKQTRRLASGTQDVADGADELADGAEKLDDGMPAFTKGTAEAAKGTENLADGMDDYAAGAKAFATGADQFSEGLQTYADRMAGFATLSRQELAAAVPCPFAQGSPQCEGFYAGFVGGTTAARQGLADQPASRASGAAAATAAECPAQQKVPKGFTPGLLTAADCLAFGADGLSDGATDIATGAGKLSTGITRLDTGADQIATGVSGVADGTRQMADGLAELAEGTDQLADGMRPLAKGIGDAATGAEKLATGTSTLSSGTRELAVGTSQSATGARSLSDGLDKLTDGGERLADGTNELADGLAKGAKQVPTYDKPTRTALAEVVATPVSAERPDSLFADIANTTYLAVVALWLGALASFVVLRAIPGRVLTSMKPSWRLAAEAWLPGAAIAAIQAVALTAVLQVLLELSAGQVAMVLPFLLLAGLAFVAVNHALVTWLGGVGRFVSVGLLVASAAAAITSAVPELMGRLVPFLPMTPALEGVRAIVSNGSGVLGSAGLLVFWLVAGAAAGVLAVARHRMAVPLRPMPLGARG